MLSVIYQQRNLYYNGYYYRGKIDGIRGPLMAQGVKRFQRDHGLAADGVVGEKVNDLLISDAKTLQIKLGVAADGLIGPDTVNAIKQHQAAHGLTVDGIAGTATWKSLNSAASSGNWDDIKYFKRSEFACDCGGRYCSGFPVEMDMQLIRLLDRLRAHFGKPITITSGVRCARRNSEVGGVPNSAHLLGKAADIYVPGTALFSVKSKAYELGAAYSYYGTSQMGNAVHINI